MYFKCDKMKLQTTHVEKKTLKQRIKKLIENVTWQIVKKKRILFRKTTSHKSAKVVAIRRYVATNSG